MSFRVRSLHVYPLKGGRGIDVESFDFDSRGPVNDRRWLLVDELGDFLTQRELPDLVHVTARPVDGGLSLSHPQAGALVVPAVSGPGLGRRVRVWNDVVDAMDQGDAIRDWGRAAFGRGVRLLRIADGAVRRTDPAFDPVGAQVGFADGYPMLIVGTASLDELNRRLEVPLPMNRFRPNVVVTTTEPHAEDGWRRFTLGSVPCEGVKPCARCVVTTTDQATGERGAEPLRTLAQYRKGEAGVLFGMNVVARGGGTVRVGDPLVVSLPRS